MPGPRDQGGCEREKGKWEETVMVSWHRYAAQPRGPCVLVTGLRLPDCSALAARLMLCGIAAA